MLSAKIRSVKLSSNNRSITILENVSFNLEAKNVYTILGKNGSGKSTLISVLTKLLDGNIYDIEAVVEFNGTNIFDLNYAKLLEVRKKQIRYVFQDSINSFDNLRKFGYYFKLSDTSEKEINELFQYFLLPDKDKIFNSYPYEVSGGMAQRLSICLALLSKPQLLILDEPTSAIDINISNILCNKLKEFVNENNSTVLLITQDLDFAENVSDYIATLSDGNLSEFNRSSEYIKKLK